MLIRPWRLRRSTPQIDRLYQLPLDEFTAARNALAKEAGAAGAQIRTLQKPPHSRLGDQSGVLAGRRGIPCPVDIRRGVARCAYGDR